MTVDEVNHMIETLDAEIIAWYLATATSFFVDKSK